MKTKVDGCAYMSDDDYSERVDINAAVVVVKKGNGADDQSELLDTVQDNIRERFALTNPDEKGNS